MNADLSVHDLLASIAAKMAEIGRHRVRAPGGTRNFDHAQDLEITWTSNAIEGNTLTAAETTAVIEHGVTIGGKPLRDHLEALDHFEAVRYVRALAARRVRLSELDVRNLHRLVVLRSNPEIAGRYADQGRFVMTDSGRHVFPSPAEIPARMADFASWLAACPDEPQIAFDAHRRLVDIHPFNDGNGRTARLLMNLILIRGAYPPIAIGPADRLAYIDGLQKSQMGLTSAAYDQFMYERLDTTLSDLLQAARSAL